jgi:hypothetical protein
MYIISVHVYCMDMAAGKGTSRVGPLDRQDTGDDSPVKLQFVVGKEPY